MSFLGQPAWKSVSERPDTRHRENAFVDGPILGGSPPPGPLLAWSVLGAGPCAPGDRSRHRSADIEKAPAIDVQG